MIGICTKQVIGVDIKGMRAKFSNHATGFFYTTKKTMINKKISFLL